MRQCGSRAGGHASAGFSLIELMIVVAIIAILAAIAIPSYQDSVWKGKRGEAKTAILRILQTEERLYTENNVYKPYAAAAAPSGYGLSNFSGDSSTNSRYTITVEQTPFTNASNTRASCVENDPSKCVRVVATVNGSADPRCGTFIAMDTAGVKLSDVANNACWN